MGDPIKYLVVISLVFFTTCRQPFDPSIPQYENLLVVEGGVNDGAPPYEVRLSRTFGFENPTTVPLREAEVTVVDDQGRVIEFSETSRGGIYQTAENIAPAEQGRSYQLQLTHEENTYHSDFMKLPERLTIDQLYYEELAKTTLDGTEFGIEIYGDISGNSPPDFYRIEWDEAWKVEAPFALYDSLRICYGKEQIQNILIGNSTSLSETQISNIPVRFINSVGAQLSDRYGIEVRVYNITEETHEFWSQLEETNESTGTLFDVLPYEIKSNLRNIDDPEEIVIGFFEAAAVSTATLFVDREELSGRFRGVLPFENCARIYYNPGCPGVLGSLFDIRQDFLVDNYILYSYNMRPCDLSEFDYMPQCYLGDTLIIDNIPTFTCYAARPENAGIDGVQLFTHDSVATEVVMASISCTDCRAYGSSVRPDFWEDE